MSTSAVELASAEAIARYEAVIGLEVHVQLATATKIFCGCPTSFGAPPNTNVCPVCLGLPGALPVLSRPAVELAIKGALALNCEVRRHSRFARKNYFYPDLPKGYQISQYDQPLAEHGYIDIEVEGVTKRIGVTRVHMEDDAGKSIHDGFRRFRPLFLRGPQPLRDAADRDCQRPRYAQLRRSLRLPDPVEAGARIHRCLDLRHGKGPPALRRQRLRAPKGRNKLGTKAEVKNLNSFRFLKQALDYEIARQVALIESGGRVMQETRLYNSETGETVGMRSKEERARLSLFPRAGPGCRCA